MRKVWASFREIHLTILEDDRGLGTSFTCFGKTGVIPATKVKWTSNSGQASNSPAGAPKPTPTSVVGRLLPTQASQNPKFARQFPERRE